jgi:hypothetical protein
MESSKIIEDQIRIYKDNFLQNADSSLGTFQNDRATQYMRFEHILKPFLEILDEKTTFHDFGCGSCDMYHYLQTRNIKVDYSGTEVIQEMIDYAQTKYPGIKLYNRDVLKEEVTDKYDIVVFSGGLYFPGAVPKEEWKEFVFKIIDKMFEMSTIGISFNLLTTYCDYTTDNLFYLDPKEILDYCIRKHSRFVNLEHGYPLYEWTVSVFRKEYIKKKYPQPEFQKYLK